MSALLANLSTKEIRTQVENWQGRATAVTFLSVACFVASAIMMSTSEAFNQKGDFFYGVVVALIGGALSVVSVYLWVRLNSLKAQLMQALEAENASHAAPSTKKNAP